MPEHVHLVMLPREAQYSISTILSTLKQSVSKRAVLFVKNNAPEFVRHMMDLQPNGQSSLRFWQRGGGYDRNLYTAAETWEKIEYVHSNPVKRGLVTVAEEWPWSSAADYAGVGTGLLAIDWGSVPDHVS